MDVTEVFQNTASEIVWNWEEFHIPYNSLQSEMKIGKYFIKVKKPSKTQTIIFKTKKIFFSSFLLLGIDKK